MFIPSVGSIYNLDTIGTGSLDTKWLNGGSLVSYLIVRKTRQKIVRKTVQVKISFFDTMLIVLLSVHERESNMKDDHYL